MTVLKADAALNDFQELLVFLRKLLNMMMLFRKVHFEHPPDFKGVDDFLRLAIDYKYSVMSRITNFTSDDPMTERSVVFVIWRGGTHWANDSPSMFSFHCVGVVVVSKDNFLGLDGLWTVTTYQKADFDVVLYRRYLILYPREVSPFTCDFMGWYLVSPGWD